MTTKTTVFQSGNSQAVRIPKAFQFQSRQVRIFKEGNRVVLEEEPESLAGAFDALRELDWPDEVLDQLKDRRPPQERDWGGQEAAPRPSAKAKAKAQTKAAPKRKPAGR